MLDSVCRKFSEVCLVLIRLWLWLCRIVSMVLVWMVLFLVMC